MTLTWAKNRNRKACCLVCVCVSVMMHIKKMALQPSSSYEGNFLDGPRSVPLIKKTSRIVEDIEENFSIKILIIFQYE